MKLRLAIYRAWKRITHRHDWRCTNRPMIGLPSSERSYWHTDQCAECGATRDVLNGYCAGQSR